MKIALIGDFNEEVPAHRAIPIALELTKKPNISWDWIHTSEINLDQLSLYSAFWCVPASPYANMENALAAINYARVNNLPFLGTCGGYQHAALEFAKNALGFSEADNAEVNPEAQMPLIASLSCKLYDIKNSISLVPNSFAQSIYSKNEVDEEYYCGYGVNAKYLSIFENSDLAFSGFDQDGDPRVLEIRKNRFFIGTAFQPERSAFSGICHPLINAFVGCIGRGG